MPVQAFIDRYLPALEAEMQSALSAPSPGLDDLYGFLRYHMGWADEQLRPANIRTGKQLRPIFCLLVCEACGGDWEQALPAAAAVELIHNFSLIHDDIEDGDATRRGRPTVWALWGMPQALNAGDTLFALAHLVLLRLVDRGVPDSIVITALQLLDQTCLRLTEGQFLDIAFETQRNVSAESYLRMVEGKTAALLATACELGALIAKAAPEKRMCLQAFGRHLGLGFQIQDDILGIWGDPQVTGKPVGSDLLRRKKTLPILHGLERSKPLQELLAQPNLTPGNANRAMALLQESGSRQWAEARSEEQTAAALAALEEATLAGPALDTLYELAQGLLNRAH